MARDDAPTQDPILVLSVDLMDPMHHTNDVCQHCLAHDHLQALSLDTLADVAVVSQNPDDLPQFNDGAQVSTCPHSSLSMDHQELQGILKVARDECHAHCGHDHFAVPTEEGTPVHHCGVHCPMIPLTLLSMGHHVATAPKLKACELHFELVSDTSAASPTLGTNWRTRKPSEANIPQTCWVDGMML